MPSRACLQSSFVWSYFQNKLCVSLILRYRACGVTPEVNDVVYVNALRKLPSWRYLVKSNESNGDTHPRHYLHVGDLSCLFSFQSYYLSELRGINEDNYHAFRSPNKFNISCLAYHKSNIWYVSFSDSPLICIGVEVRKLNRPGALFCVWNA